MALLLRFGRPYLSLSSRVFRKAVPTVSYGSDPTKMPTDEEQATGIEKIELEALNAGIEDPFNVKTIHGKVDGTRDNPQKVPSMYPERIVACLCEEPPQIYYLQLKAGPPQRCYCGHWLQLVKGSSVKVDM